MGDVNNDGFLDLAKGRNLWVQQANENHWIKFKLNGIQSNLMGIGAWIVIYTKDQIQLRELRAEQGYAAMSSLQITFWTWLKSIHRQRTCLLAVRSYLKAKDTQK